MAVAILDTTVFPFVLVLVVPSFVLVCVDGGDHFGWRTGCLLLVLLDRSLAGLCWGFSVFPYCRHPFLLRMIVLLILLLLPPATAKFMDAFAGPSIADMDDDTLDVFPPLCLSSNTLFHALPPLKLTAIRLNRGKSSGACRCTCGEEDAGVE